MSEYNEQCKVFEWASYHTKKYPFLSFMFSTLNGVPLTIIQGRKAKKSGNKKGVPDIILPYPSQGYHGLFIELKFGKNRPTKYQKEYIEYLNAHNYKAVVSYGAKEAIREIREYIG